MAVSVVRQDRGSPYVRRGGYTLQLCADPAQFAAVRRIVGAHLRLWGRERLIDVAALCVTEMLANVHRHVSAPECELALRNLPEGIRAAVSDGSSVLPVVAEPDWCAESGRGMFLLAHAAACWGAVPTATGKTVWAAGRGVNEAALTAEFINCLASWAWLEETSAGPVAFLLLAHPEADAVGAQLALLVEGLGLAPPGRLLPDTGERVLVVGGSRAAVVVDDCPQVVLVGVGERWAGFVRAGGRVAVLVGMAPLARCSPRADVEVYLAEATTRGLLRLGAARVTGVADPKS